MNARLASASRWVPTAVNVVAFDIVWAATVFGAAAGLAWSGPVAFLAFAALHFRLTTRPRYDLAAMAVFGVAGIIIDSAWSLSGALSYAAGWPSPWFAPLWMVTLWMAFSLTVGHSLRWLIERPRLTVVFGFFCGAFSYWIGARIGAVELAISSGLYALLVGICWAVAFPVLLRLTAVLARPRLPAYQC